jgi:hypothetical protein
MYDTDDIHDVPPDDERPRYRTVEFTDGLVIYDRTATQRWMHADTTVSLEAMR